MIKYALKCENGHSFESWFASAEAFDKLATSGLLTCTICGSGQVAKAIMAPRVRTKRGTAAAPVEPPTSEDAPAPPPALSDPANPIEARIKEMRKKIEAESEYVGDKFAKEARAIHTGDAPERAIYGEAKPADAKALIEDGVPVAALPFVPDRKTN